MTNVTDITSIPLYQILGAPLLAIVQAEIQAAQTTTQFIEQVGFYTEEEAEALGDGHHYGDLRTVTFSYTKTGVGGQETTFKVSVPIISIVPIPAIQVKEATVDFAVEINDAVELESNTQLSVSPASNQDDSIESRLVMFKAGLASSDSKTAMKVSMTIEQADTAVGMQALYRVMEQGISSVSQNTSSTTDSSNGEEGISNVSEGTDTITTDTITTDTMG